MNCCSPQRRTDGIGPFFSWFAKTYTKRFRKKGLEPSQKQLYSFVEHAGYQGKSILEIGCGVGFFHQLLLESGAKTAVGVDISDKMIEEARSESERRGLSDRTEYSQGDFVDLSESVQSSEITILDKVICCYPDPVELIGKSTERTNSQYAVTYPRKRWLNLFLMEVLAPVVLWVIRAGFRPYMHDPSQIEELIVQGGFEKKEQAETMLWRTQIFQRTSAAS